MTSINLNKFFFSLHWVRSKLMMHETFENAILCSSCQLVDPCMPFVLQQVINRVTTFLSLDDFENLIFPHIRWLRFELMHQSCFKICNTLTIFYNWSILTPCIRFVRHAIGYQPGSLHHTQATVLGDQQGHGAAGRRRLLTLCDGLRKVIWTSNLTSPRTTNRWRRFARMHRLTL